MDQPNFSIWTLVADARASSIDPSSSVASEWVKGQTLDEVLELKNSDIAAHLKLPPVKFTAKPQRPRVAWYASTAASSCVSA